MTVRSVATRGSVEAEVEAVAGAEVEAGAGAVVAAAAAAGV